MEGEKATKKKKEKCIKELKYNRWYKKIVEGGRRYTDIP